MAENTKIEWADDSVSFWWGCTHHGPGCRFCYAEAMSKRFGDFWGPTKPRLLIDGAVKTIIRLNRKAEREGKPRIVFINSMSDFFEGHDGPIVSRNGNRAYRFEFGVDGASFPAPGHDVPFATLNDLRKEAFDLFDECPWLRFLLLTKRPENIRKMWSPTKWGGRCADFPDCTHPNCRAGRQRPNVWIGTSISTQEDAEQSLPHLLQCGDLAPVLFASLEPLLEAVDLTAVQAPASLQKSPNGGLKYNALALDDDEHFYRPPAKLSLVIVGGESGGHRARPMHPQWALDLRDQCNANDTAFFFKQWGQNAPYEIWQAENGVDADCQFWLHEDGRIDTGDMRPHGSWQLMASIGKIRAGRLLDGRVHDEMPEVRG